MLEHIKLALIMLAILLGLVVGTVVVTLTTVIAIHQTAVWIDKIEHYYDFKREDKEPIVC